MSVDGRYMLRDPLMLPFFYTRRCLSCALHVATPMNLSSIMKIQITLWKIKLMQVQSNADKRIYNMIDVLREGNMR